MVDVNMLLDYMTRFRLECHCRLDMVPADIKELPIFMYKAAQESARDNMLKELGLSKEDIEVINRVSEFFLKTLEETNHFGKSDDITIEAIKAGKLTN